jgi:hypothetical protein
MEELLSDRHVKGQQGVRAVVTTKVELWREVRSQGL